MATPAPAEVVDYTAAITTCAQVLPVVLFAAFYELRTRVIDGVFTARFAAMSMVLLVAGEGLALASLAGSDKPSQAEAVLIVADTIFVTASFAFLWLIDTFNEAEKNGVSLTPEREDDDRDDDDDDSERESD